ncbi:hypothetical protein [Sandarakinorhabdus sp.]|uniref:hypothetical protein n=1 Tax=Sandarakinorhabdus sp. TaxID=1916663 RepID=UPI003F6FBC2C
MAADPASDAQAPPLPVPVLSLAITGHRTSNADFAGQQDRIASVIASIFATVSACSATAPVRLHSLLADGADQLAATLALARGWALVAPLPFGRGLNRAINAHPTTAADAQLLMGGQQPVDPQVAASAAAIDALYDRAHLFELADADDGIAEKFLAMLSAPGDVVVAQRYTAATSRRVALAGRVMIEQADILLAVWDGAARDAPGGTGHTLAAALAVGVAVVLIDARNPEAWHMLDAVEALEQPGDIAGRDAQLAAAVHGALAATGHAATALASTAWRSRSNPIFHAYRRIEAVFGGNGRPWRNLTLVHEPPQAIATGSGAPLLAAIAALPGADPAWPNRIGAAVLARFAWADGISTRYSDQYRGGMVTNFVASLTAILAGVTYLPLSVPESKWAFALAEFLLLGFIVLLTARGHRGHWHDRWFETRRAAEYLRHAPFSLVLGVGRPRGRWPRGPGADWPEHHARHALREIGLPQVAITRPWLRAALAGLLLPHLAGQRDYHQVKAQRLAHVHHRLDAASETAFKLALASVAIWLLLWTGGAMGLIAPVLAEKLAKLFTYLGIMFPSIGGAFAGIRYFGDFDRFAAISRVSAEKLDALHRRASLLLATPEATLDYGNVADLAHAADDVVVSEIESWQAVFAGKHFAVPV